MSTTAEGPILRQEIQTFAVIAAAFIAVLPGSLVASNRRTASQEPGISISVHGVQWTLTSALGVAALLRVIRMRISATIWCVAALVLTMESAEGAPSAGASQAPISLTAAQQSTIGIETMVLDASPAAGMGRLSFGGRVEFADRAPAAVLAPGAGRVTAVYAHPGESVKRGEPLLTVAGPDIAMARSGLEAAAAAAESANRRAARDKALFDAGAIPRSRLDGSEAQDRTAAAALGAARSVLSTGIFEPTGGLRLQAPVGGRVMGPALAPGDTVSAGQVLAYVANVPEMHVAISVPLVIARSLTVDDGVLISSPSCEAAGRVHAVGQDIEPDSQAVAVHISLDGPTCFAPGESVTAKLAPRPSDRDSYAVPATAFVTVGAQTFVFLVTDKGFLPVEVDASGARAGYARSTTLHRGQRVVIRGTAVLKAEWLKRIGA